MRIVPYEDKYRDDMIFMVLEAKDALGRAPTLNRDLLGVGGHYKGRFWLALSAEDRVIMISDGQTPPLAQGRRLAWK